MVGQSRCRGFFKRSPDVGIHGYPELDRSRTPLPHRPASVVNSRSLRSYEGIRSSKPTGAFFQDERDLARMKKARHGAGLRSLRWIRSSIRGESQRVRSSAPGYREQ